MNYCSIDAEQKQHLLKLVDFLYLEVISSGGDGDALWYSKHYDIKDILPLIQEYNSNLKFKWLVEYDEGRKLISWWYDQECCLITNNEEIYKNAPSWQQILINY